MRSIFSKWKQVFTVTLLAMALPLSAVAQAYPSKPIKMIVPFPAGGTTDIVARLIAQKMTDSMGQPVTVDNKGGAGGNIGADLMAKAAPDGYTIMMHNLSFPLAAVAQALANRAPFNVDTDFAGVSIAVYVPFIWTSSPSVPAKDLKELANLLKSNKSLQYNYGSTGPGSRHHRAVSAAAQRHNAPPASGAGRPRLHHPGRHDLGRRARRRDADAGP